MQENTEKRSSVKGVVKVIVFLAALVAVGMLLSGLLQQKWGYSDNAAQQIVEGYYEEPDDSIDVLFLGASTIRNGISALEMWADHGFTAYSRASSIQSPVVSYYLLKETLKNQDLKAVVVDASTLSNVVNETAKGEEKLHEVVDFMPWSIEKLELINDIVNTSDNGSVFDFISPLYRYHDRWESLSEQDFTSDEWVNDYWYKGQYPSLTVKKYSYPVDYMTEEATIDTEYYIDETAEYYFDSMIRLCKSEGIEFVLIHTPAGSWDLEKNKLLSDYADEHGVDYLDFSTLELHTEIGFDPKTDYVDDGRHPNITGAQKISRYLAEYLSEKCELEDKRENEDYSNWWECYDQYASLLKIVDIREKSNLVELLKVVKENPEYLAVVTTRNDTSKYFNKEIQSCFADLGLEEDLSRTSYLSYAAVIYGGEVLLEKSAENEAIDESLEVSGHMVRVTSYANAVTGNYCQLYLDGDAHGQNKQGLNLIVYDFKTNQIVFSRSFNLGRDGTDYSTVTADDFSSLAGTDPVGLLEMACSEQFITVMAVKKDAARYLPGDFDAKLQELGLESLKGKVNCPAIAILDGGEVVYSGIGEQYGTLTKKTKVDGININVISSAAENNSTLRMDIGGVKIRYNTGNGLYYIIYNKETGEEVYRHFFRWASFNYNEAEYDFANLTDITSYVEIAQMDGYDVFVVYDGTQTGVSSETLTAVKELGFTDIGRQAGYIGVMKAGADQDTEGVFVQLSRPESISYDLVMGKRPIRLYAGPGIGSVIQDGYDYGQKAGVITGVYDPETDSLLSVKGWE